jgi:hypothetical protein
MPFLKRLGSFPTYKFSLLCGTFVASIGLLAFILNWFLFNHSLPAYSLLLAPGNLVLSLFSEEINFIPKLILLVFGQFIVTTAVVWAGYATIKKLRMNYGNRLANVSKR